MSTVSSEKISAWQVGLLLISIVLPTAILFIPGIAAKQAFHDAWFTPLVAIVPATFTVLINLSLGQRFPGKTIIQYSVDIAGPYLGRLIGLIYILALFDIAAVIVLEYTILLDAAILPQTPSTVFYGSIILLSAYSIRLGIEVIARVNELLLPLLLVSLVLGILLLAKDVQLVFLQPVLSYNGITNILRGSVVPSTWASEIAVLSFMLPFVHDQEKMKRYALTGVLLVALLLAIVTVVTIGILGSYETARLELPMLSVFRVIQIGMFLERVDALVLAFWVAGMFMKFTLFYYFIMLAVTQFFKLEDYRPLTLPVGLTIGTFSAILFTNVAELVEFLGKAAPFFPLLLSELGLPLLLLFTAIIRQKGGISGGSKSGAGGTDANSTANYRMLGSKRAK